MIAASNIRVAFGDKTVLHDVSVELPSKGTIGIVGPNGCGKTTLLRSLYGSQSVDAGSATLRGQNITSIPRRALAREIAVVVQESVSEIPVTVADLVMLGRLPYQRFSSQPTDRDEEIVTTMLQRVGMLDKASQNFAQLSGGERQRALIARAFAQESEILLLDEPTNHLDIRYQHEVLTLLRSSQGVGLVVLHDLNLAAKYCDKILVMDKGHIVAEGSPREVLTPKVLEPVYNVAVQRLEVDGQIHLIFDLPIANL